MTFSRIAFSTLIISLLLLLPMLAVGVERTIGILSYILFPNYNKRLEIAVVTGGVSELEALLATHNKIYDPKKLILLSASQGRREMLDLLFKSGLDIRFDEDMPLVVAAKFGQTYVISYLLQKGARLDAQHNSALFGAIDNGKENTALFIISQYRSISACVAKEALAKARGSALVRAEQAIALKAKLFDIDVLGRQTVPACTK